MKSKLLAVLFMFPFFVSAQSLQELYSASKKSYENKEFALFLKQTKTLDSLRPSHPAFTYNLAVAYAANGLQNESLAVLKRAVLMNNKTEFETAEEFSGFTESEAFKKLVQLKADLENPVVSSQKLVSLSEKDLHPEGLAYLTKTNVWLAGSIHKRKIVSFDVRTGVCGDWLKADDMLAVFAIKSDKYEKYLWVATSAMPEMEGFKKEQDGNAEVLKIEIATRKIVKRYSIKGKHVFGDIAISNTGEVFISDSANPILYTIRKDVLQEWVNLENTAFNLQGIAFNADGSRLFVADYLKGILSISVQNPQERRWLKFPDNATHKGIDGLVFHDNSLIAVHNGVNPIRLVRYYLNNKNEISEYKVLDHNRAEFDEPALATVKGNELYFFANSPWKAYDKSFKLNLEAFKNPMLFTCGL